MRGRGVVTLLVVMATVGAAGAGTRTIPSSSSPTAKVALRPGVISLVSVPPGDTVKDAVGGSGKAAGPPAGVSSSLPPLAAREALSAIQQAPGGAAALGQIAAAQSKSVADLIGAAAAALSPATSPVVPTNWFEGVILSPHRLRTSGSDLGYAYLEILDPCLSGDLLPPAYWPQNDVAVLDIPASGPTMTFPGGVRARQSPLIGAHLYIGNHPSLGHDAYVIELGLRGVSGTNDWDPHVMVNAAYVPLARVGSTDRYLGVVNLDRGVLYLLRARFRSTGENRIAFYYLKVQRIAY